MPLAACRAGMASMSMAAASRPPQAWPWTEAPSCMGYSLHGPPTSPELPSHMPLCENARSAPPCRRHRGRCAALRPARLPPEPRRRPAARLRGKSPAKGYGDRVVAGSVIEPDGCWTCYRCSLRLSTYSDYSPDGGWRQALRLMDLIALGSHERARRSEPLVSDDSSRAHRNVPCAGREIAQHGSARCDTPHGQRGRQVWQVNVRWPFRAAQRRIRRRRQSD